MRAGGTRESRTRRNSLRRPMQTATAHLTGARALHPLVSETGLAPPLPETGPSLTRANGGGA